MRTTDPAGLALVRRWAMLLDTAFRVPGTNMRFGLDPILGLVPGLGDLTAPAFTALLLVTGFRLRVPAIVQARMVLNAGLDMLLGLVPFVGDVADFAWKANVRNLALLERHARPGVPPAPADFAFVFVCLGLVALIGLVPLLLIAWVLWSRPFI